MHTAAEKVDQAPHTQHVGIRHTLFTSVASGSIQNNSTHVWVAVDRAYLLRRDACLVRDVLCGCVLCGVVSWGGDEMILRGGGCSCSTAIKWCCCCCC
jgi:hypothetical protein